MVRNIAALALGVVIGAFLVPFLVPLVVPMSHYYELRSVTISGTTSGNSPNMLVDRVIHRDFRGRYEVQILKEHGSEMVPFWSCGPYVSDWRTYRQEDRLPEELDLNWWMDIPPNRECELPPGRYKVITTIFAQTWFGAVLSVEQGSNIFEVRRSS